MAYGKQKCRRCERKYCATCAPRVFQVQFQQRSFDHNNDYETTTMRFDNYYCVSCEHSSSLPIVVVDSMSHQSRGSAQQHRGSVPNREVTTSRSVLTLDPESTSGMMAHSVEREEEEERDHRLAVFPKHQLVDQGVERTTREPVALTGHWSSPTQEHNNSDDPSWPRVSTTTTLSFLTSLPLAMYDESPRSLTTPDPG